MTGLFDATAFASCRMYASAAEVWSGLGKNATEGMAKPVSLPVWTVLLAGGQVLPLVLVLVAPSVPALAALVLSVGLRLILAARFRQPEVERAAASGRRRGPAGGAMVRAGPLARGRPAMWRGRAYPAQ